jgi:uncharacterized protein YecE (DUF72 family)
MDANEGRSPDLPVRIGCPVWACDQWPDIVYPKRTPRDQWLRWYSQMFNTVEGNCVFWSIPTSDTTARWAKQAAEGFEFCVKVPRIISHDQMLLDCSSPLAAFFEAMRPLADAKRLGPSFLQLPPPFGSAQFDRLIAFLDRWPTSMPLAVEVRHRDFFDQGDHEHRLDEALAARSIDRVLLDSQALYGLPPGTECEAVSQTRKPRSPLRTTVTAARPMVRLIGRDKASEVDERFAFWSREVTKWVGEGRRPYVFVHAPDDRFAPELVRRFWSMHLAPMLGMGSEALPKLPEPLKQLDLFERDWPA